MDPAFSPTVAEWQTYYFTFAAVTATLTGLLFVAVSLHLDQFTSPERPELRVLAFKTFVGFLSLLLAALYFLVPRQTPLGLGGPLVLTAVGALVIVWRDTPFSGALIRRTWGWRFFVWRALLPGLCQLGVLGAALALAAGRAEALPLLVPLFVVLLLASTHNAWDLLVQAGIERRADAAARAPGDPQLRRLEQQLRAITRRQRQITRQQEDSAAHSGPPPPPRRRG